MQVVGWKSMLLIVLLLFALVVLVCALASRASGWVVLAPPGPKLFLVGSDGLHQLAVDDRNAVFGKHCKDVESLLGLLGLDLLDLVALGHGLKMNQTTLPVYRENHFSVDFEENPMFAGAKQGSNSL
jgi:hypothetical protein